MSTQKRLGWLKALVSWRTAAILLIWIVSLAGAGLAGAYAYRDRTAIRARFASVQSSRIIETNLYNLSVRLLSVPAEGRDGGIDPLGDGILFVNRLGTMWYVDQDLGLHDLTLRVPINYDEFEADPYNVNTNRRGQFAVKDLLVQPRREGVRLLTSYNYWYSDRDCYVVRVASFTTSVDSLLSGSADRQDQWKTVFETPCGKLTENPNGINRNPTLASAGRLAALSDHEILVTFGGFGPEEVTPNDSQTQRYDNPFGKTVLLDLNAGTSRIYTLGHRNPEGLAVAPTGEIWLTEHGERGGDELNRIVEGKNYGFPIVSYGTHYGSMEWSPTPTHGYHEGYEKPIYAWVPSIGVSQALVVKGPLFDRWKGDVLVSSLGARSLYRVHIEEGRVIFAEPIPMLHRIRDMTEASDGTIVLKTDDNFLVFIRPLDAETEDLSSLDAPTRGQLLSSDCSGCHSFDRDGADGIGPNLWGVVGRRVASRETFGYSNALSAVGGRWTPELLRRFLANPNDVALGTAMEMTRTYTDDETADLLAYLQTLR